jgi:hypothetical protein
LRPGLDDLHRAAGTRAKTRIATITATGKTVMTVRKLEKSEWSAFFDGVSKGLKGAQAEIEIASLKLGDQVQSTWLPLFGVVYDPKDDIFEIALAGLDHLVQKPREVYVDEEAGKLVNVEIIDGDDNHQIVRFREPIGAPPRKP